MSILLDRSLQLLISLHQKVGKHVIVCHVEQLIDHRNSLFMHLKKTLSAFWNLCLNPERRRLWSHLLVMKRVVMPRLRIRSLRRSTKILLRLSIRTNSWLTWRNSRKIIGLMVSLRDILDNTAWRLVCPLVWTMMQGWLSIYLATRLHWSKLLLISLSPIWLHLLLAQTSLPIIWSLISIRRSRGILLLLRSSSHLTTGSILYLIKIFLQIYLSRNRLWSTLISISHHLRPLMLILWPRCVLGKALLLLLVVIRCW